jgi:hypothetical protein
MRLVMVDDNDPRPIGDPRPRSGNVFNRLNGDGERFGNGRGIVAGVGAEVDSSADSETPVMTMMMAEKAAAKVSAVEMGAGAMMEGKAYAGAGWSARGD